MRRRTKKDKLTATLNQKSYQAIITEKGKLIPLNEWSNTNHLAAGMLSKHLSAAEVEDENGNFVISEIVIKMFELIRAQKGGKPIKINSGYRSQKKQNELREYYRKQGYDEDDIPAAVVSTHSMGLALDLDGRDKSDTRALYNAAEHVRKVYLHDMRIGYFSYKNKGITAVHIDCAPYYFGNNGVWSKWETVPNSEGSIPDSWKKATTW
jgi:LAS superfamily LD-carboxypeptidase LdcB